jgi:hypothetical protein
MRIIVLFILSLILFTNFEIGIFPNSKIFDIQNANYSINRLNSNYSNISCIHGFFEAQKGSVNISVPNLARGEGVIVATGSDIKNPKGYILFFSNSNYSVWWTQTAGNESYSFDSNGAVIGYLSCFTGLSMKILRFDEGKTFYMLPTENYSRFFVIIACYNFECPNASVAGQVTKYNYSYKNQNYTLAFYYGLFSFNGDYVFVKTSTSYSFVFLIGISEKIYGWIRGTVYPPNAIVLVNGTRYTIKNGALNLSLPFGMYNITFLAKGYSTLSVIVPVYGGEVTPLSVKLPSWEDRLIIVVNTVLKYYIPTLLVVCIIAIMIYILKKDKKV